MKFSSPDPQYSLVELSQAEFEKLLATIDNLKAEREFIIQALRDEVKSCQYLIRVLAGSAEVVEVSPPKRRYTPRTRGVRT